MSDYLELWSADTRRLLPLSGDRVTIGKADANDVTVDNDPSVSRMHALIERVPAGWIVQDLNSTNGTFVNGERLLGTRPLRPGDEVRVGSSRLVFRSVTPAAGTATTAEDPVPELTRREREVLLALCGPLTAGDVYTEPASVREIASRLVITEAAVRQHLMRLYDKFGIAASDERRRGRLANDAIRRGAVSISEIKAFGD